VSCFPGNRKGRGIFTHNEGPEPGSRTHAGASDFDTGEGMHGNCKLGIKKRGSLQSNRKRWYGGLGN